MYICIMCGIFTCICSCIYVRVFVMCIHLHAWANVYTNECICMYIRMRVHIYSGREVRELGFTWDIAPEATVTPEDSGLTDIDYSVEPFSDAISNGHAIINSHAMCNGHPRVRGWREKGEMEGGRERAEKSERERARESGRERESERAKSRERN